MLLLRVDYSLYICGRTALFLHLMIVIYLVLLGTADLKMLECCLGGNFIISAITFPYYFYKDNLKEAKN